jgi:glycosyltransferase involved in cell wall biosynthesis
VSAPLISCIVPVYNGELFLDEALDSILAQSYRPIEVIIIDDGSTDGTANIIRNHLPGVRGGLVRSIRQENAGQVAATNRAVEAASGELLAFLDADDVWHPEKLSRQSAHLADHPEVDVSFTLVQNFWIDELAEEAERFRDHRIARPIPGYIMGTMLARRRAFDVAGFFDVGHDHAHTQEWVLRARAHGLMVALLPETLTRRRLHPGNRSRAAREHSRDDFLNVLKLDLDRRRGA